MGFCFTQTQRGTFQFHIGAHDPKEFKPLDFQTPVASVYLSPLISYSQAGGDKFTTHPVELHDISPIFKLTIKYLHVFSFVSFSLSSSTEVFLNLRNFYLPFFLNSVSHKIVNKSMLLNDM